MTWDNKIGTQEQDQRTYSNTAEARRVVGTDTSGTEINFATEDSLAQLALSIINAIDETGYDLNAAAFNETTNITSDFILDNIEFNFSTTESKTITITSTDGTKIWEDTNTNQHIFLDKINAGINANENITIVVTQFSGAGTMDCIAKIRQGTNTLVGNPTIGEGTNTIGEVLIKSADSESVDAFGRYRVSNPANLFDNKNIHNRRKSQWEEPVIGAIIVYSNLAGGPFQVAETITGGTSGTVGIVTAVNGGSLTVTYTVNHNDFEVGEEITGGTSGATADVDSANTGSHVSHDRDTASVILQVGQLDGDQAVRTSHRYFPYFPGKSQLIGQTFLFGSAVTDVRRRVGYFDPDNGIFLEQTSTGLRIVRRTKTSGSVVDNLVEQANWSEDAFDGNGPSGITLDFTKIQFLQIDFQWQGTGRVRVSFVHNGIAYPAHHFNTSNTLSVPWASTPSLPVRYEIMNTGATAGANTMKEICTSVVSEAGEKLGGIGFSASNDVTSRAVTTEAPILAIRLKNTFGSDSGKNRRTVQFSNGGIFATTKGAHFEIKHVHDPTGITATWTDVGGGSAAEFSTDISAVTSNPGHRIEEGYADAGQGGKGGSGIVEGDKIDQHRFVTQNIDSDNSEMFIIFATALTGTSNVYGHMSWVEFD